MRIPHFRIVFRLASPESEHLGHVVIVHLLLLMKEGIRSRPCILQSTFPLPLRSFWRVYAQELLSQIHDEEIMAPIVCYTLQISTLALYLCYVSQS